MTQGHEKKNRSATKQLFLFLHMIFPTVSVRLLQAAHIPLPAAAVDRHPQAGRRQRADFRQQADFRQRADFHPQADFRRPVGSRQQADFRPQAADFRPQAAGFRRRSRAAAAQPCPRASSLPREAGRD